jgi:hypothetical protein
MRLPAPRNFRPHELRTKSGAHRLIIVSREPARAGSFNHAHSFALEPHVFTPAGVMSKPVFHNDVEIYFPSPKADPDAFGSTQHLRFYAGQLDPADPAHFTIRYDLLNQSGNIDDSWKMVKQFH